MSSRTRHLLFALALAVSIFALGPWAVSRAADAASPPPTGTWRLDPATAPGVIEGYASELSVAPGDRLHLHTSTSPAARYRVEIYRIGWYDGTGGQLFGCIPSCTEDEAGVGQSVPSPDSSTGELHAGWPVTSTPGRPTTIGAVSASTAIRTQP